MVETTSQKKKKEMDIPSGSKTQLHAHPPGLAHYYHVAPSKHAPTLTIVNAVKYSQQRLPAGLVNSWGWDDSLYIDAGVAQVCMHMSI